MGRDDPDRKKKKRRKEKEPALLGDSGVTDDQRRELRREQRSLHKRINDEDDRGEEEDAMDYLERGRSDNNDLFGKVTHTREAVLDGFNQELLVNKAKQQMSSLITVPRFDANKLAKKIKSKCSKGAGSSKQMDWAMMGRECAVCFNAIPRGVSFLAGTMDSQVQVVKKARKPRAKRMDMKDVEEQRPEQLDAANNKGDADQLSAAEKAMKKLKKTLKKHSQHEEDGSVCKEVDGVKFLFNPKSFTQTVENIFNYSFLVKKGEGEIGVRPPEEANEAEGKLAGLYVRKVPEAEVDQAQASSYPQTQAVVSFTMRDFRRICQAHDLKEGLLKHRTGSKHAKRASQSQQH